jgi:hypothetical protein
LYGLPAEFDARVFVQRALVQMCFSVNTISLSFDGAMITVESSVIYKRDPTDPGEAVSPPVSRTSMTSVIGKTVRFASSKPDGSLSLHFDDGQALMFSDDSETYESYKIQIGEQEIIV